MTTPTPAPAPALTHTEPVYTVQELADLWKLSPDSIRKLFKDEQGVRVLKTLQTRRRTYSTLRIPASVAERVWRRMEQPGR